MAKTIEDLETQALTAGNAEEEFEEDPSEEDGYSQDHEDLVGAVSLLEETVVLLGYISNPNFCKQLSKRERDTLVRFNARIGEFVQSLQVDEAME